MYLGKNVMDVLEVNGNKKIKPNDMTWSLKNKGLIFSAVCIIDFIILLTS